MSVVESQFNGQDKNINRLILPTVLTPLTAPSIPAYAGSLAYDPVSGDAYLGSNGSPSVWSQAGSLGVAQFENVLTQTVAAGTPFVCSTTIYNNTDYITANSAIGGTVYLLGQPGSYSIEYEMSATAAASLAIYKGPNSGSLVIDNATVSGSTGVTSWIHGKAIEVVTGNILIIALSPATGSVTTATAGTNSQFMVRVTITKFA